MPCPSHRGSWENKYVAERVALPDKEELQNDHWLANKQDLPIHLLGVWRREGPQSICCMMTT